MTKPVQRTRANNVIKLSVYPNMFKKINVDKMEMGTVKNGIIEVVMFFKITNIIRVTSITANHRVRNTSCKASDTNNDVS